MDKNEKYRDLEEKIKKNWDKTSDKTKKSYEELTEKVIDKYEGTKTWTQTEMAEAKEYIRGLYDKLKK